MSELALSIKGLKKTYPNGFTALKGIDLDVKPGDFYALLGPNGAGKSTTIGIIASLVNKGEGDVSVFGHDIEQAPMKVKSLIGLVTQEFNFNPFNKVHALVSFQARLYGIKRKEASERADQLLKALGLWDKRNEPARNLSGGMKRRLLIARALVHKPKLLILDEPTAGVDIELRRSMWEFLVEINRQGTTIILTTHYLEEAEQLCNHIAIINGGEIVANADKKSLLGKLKVETVVLALGKDIQALPDLGEFRGRLVDSTTLEVDVCHTQNLNALFARLTHLDVCVKSVRSKTNRLEELFLNLVGEKS